MMRDRPGWCSKATDWPAAPGVTRAELVAACGGEDALRRVSYPAAVVYAGGAGAPPDDFAWHPPETIFLLRRPDGDWLVNTEGYSYARYTMRVAPEPKEHA